MATLHDIFTAIKLPKREQFIIEQLCKNNLSTKKIAQLWETKTKENLPIDKWFNFSRVAVSKFIKYCDQFIDTEAKKTTVAKPDLRTKLQNMASLMQDVDLSKPTGFSAKPLKTVLTLALTELNLSARTVHYLTAGGYQTVKDLQGKTHDDILAIARSGQRPLNELCQTLGQHAKQIFKPQHISTETPENTSISQHQHRRPMNKERQRTLQNMLIQHPWHFSSKTAK